MKKKRNYDVSDRQRMMVVAIIMQTFLWILLILIQLATIAAMIGLISIFVLGMLTVPWVPTKTAIAREMCQLAGLKAGERVLDLGCGDGSVLLCAAKEFGAVAIGFELHPILVWVGRIRARLAGISNRVTLRRADMFKTPLPDADVVVLYLFPSFVARLEPILRARYSKGTRIVSRAFAAPTLTLIESRPVGKEKLYLYDCSLPK